MRSHLDCNSVTVWNNSCIGQFNPRFIFNALSTWHFSWSDRPLYGGILNTATQNKPSNLAEPGSHLTFVRDRSHVVCGFLWSLQSRATSVPPKRPSPFPITPFTFIIGPFFLFLGAFIESTLSFVMSVCPHGTTRLPLDGFSWNLVFEKFLKICLQNSSYIKL